MEEKQARAESFNCELYVGGHNEVLLDLDNKEDIEKLKERVNILRAEGLSIEEYERWSSKSGNLHVVLSLTRNRSIFQKLLIQSFLGSDQRHVNMAYLRYISGDENYNVLFKPKREKVNKMKLVER